MVIEMKTGVLTQIEDANTLFMRHFENHDALALAELYTDDAQLLPPNSDFVTGKAGIQAFWKAIFDMGIAKATLEIAEVEDRGDTAIEISRYKMLGPGDQILDSGKYIVIWRMVDGHWRLHRDIFNSSLPPTGQ